MAAPQIPNAQKVYHVTWQDLPLSCPMPAMTLWNSHQRVYLDIQEGGVAQCPYCSSVYILEEQAEPNEELAQPNIEIEGLQHRAREHTRRHAK